MCGRYYVDDETAREIEKIVRELDKKLQIERAGDIRPSDAALVLSQRAPSDSEADELGISGFQGKGLLINARAEGVLEENLPGERAASEVRHSGKGFMSGIREKKNSVLKEKSRCCLWQDASISFGTELVL